MLMAFTLLSFLTRIPLGFTVFRSCVPNTNFQLNGKICACDSLGRWNEANCHNLARRQSCQPGQIIWGNCTQCLCQEDGEFVCTPSSCPENITIDSPTFQGDLEVAGPWCTPFKSYYINCSLCVCPASGRSSEARCAVDTSCSLQGLSESSITSGTICIPSVMYLFPCLHCLCSDEGYFVPKDCVDICHKSQQTDNRRCIPGTFYRKRCNVCRCPNNSIRSGEKCTNKVCEKKTKFRPVRHFKDNVSECTPHKFTKPKCYYCMCSQGGKVNENACLELDCLKKSDFKYDVERHSCNPGEMVPICMECFCPRNGLTDKKYCTKVCSFKSKLVVLEKALEASFIDVRVINIAVIKSSADINCDPNSLYLDRGRYCLCPENGNSDFKLCTSITNEIRQPKSHVPLASNAVTMDFNISCEPNTFVDFDCNTCYCSKNGRIDPKWCTYDDCQAKKVIQDHYKLYQPLTTTKPTVTCNPGSISKEECNFCICPENGLFKDRACTKNDCSDFDDSIHDQKFICEPLAYYVVDCNVCFCPRDGLKNVAKCTKNQCEKNFLRSDSCISGDLFSEDCNVCVCPPNGDKNDKACTNYSCSAANSSWQKIFKLSQNLLSSRMADNSKRSLHLCFPGEEFVDGCKVCVCPDMGMKEYASCTPMFCNEAISESDVEYQTPSNGSKFNDLIPSNDFKTRKEGDSCMTYNLTDSSERKECTPGSIYIIRCRQCICPYMGNINHFCRPLPKNVYCEQAFPYFNYLPMGRRGNKGDLTPHHNGTSRNNTILKEVTVSHNHTKHFCSEPGQVRDDCYICDCEDHVIIEEHCFKSDAGNCTDAVPTLLDKLVTAE
ncbi:hypothetical protein O3G_MSEX012093 [Manduca sexta]|uniref:Pacifastin domain-containing protein n=2 Tax=Manduca sexta TaxID=7130 RepID=A0A922CWI7_MANSE|nr:hypothetical protein O3G_MSEX012093 [Manduca sexta]